MEEIEGNRRKLAGRIQELYGISREEAQETVNDWEDQQKKTVVSCKIEQRDDGISPQEVEQANPAKAGRPENTE